MTSPVDPRTLDPRAVVEYKVPATELRAGDIINTSPGEDDWQQVLSVHLADAPGSEAEMVALVEAVGDRYVIVQLTDVAPVDSPVYFADGTAYAFGSEADSDTPVTEIVSADAGTRIFLYTRFELVTLRA